MELLKQLLASANIKIQNLDKELKALGFDDSNLSDDDAQKAFEQLKAKTENKLAINNKGKQTMSNLSPKPQDNQTIDAAMDTAAKKVDNMVQNAQAFATKISEKKANQILGIVNSIPDLTLSRVKQLADDSGNLDFFRGEIEDFEKAFSSKFDID